MALQKHLLNDPSTLVVDSLQGLLQVNHQLSLDSAHKVVYRSKVDKSKVHIICGGGAGHEPSHAGFVGSGLLSAAVSGNVFASPNPTQVRKGIELVDNDKGTIIIVKNYTGDILNFGLAKEHYAAQHPDKAEQVKFLVVGDDVAVGKTQGSIVGRRGLAGVCLVYKLAGALADQGASLQDVFAVAEYAASRVGTIGVGLEHCHVPGTAVGESHLATTEVEIGLGIHNEPGNKRVPLGRLDDLVPQLVDLLANTSDPERGFLPFQNDGQDEVVLLVNNLGGMSELELSGVVFATQKVLDQRKIKVARVLSGSFMTSLNMPGFSLTLLLLPRAGDSAAPSKDHLLSLLDAKAEAPGWKWGSSTSPSSLKSQAQSSTQSTSPSGTGHSPIKAADPARFVASIEKAAHAVIAAEPEITRMDTIAGDGDCGLTLKSGATAVLNGLKNGTITGDDVIGAVLHVSRVGQEDMDGTSGALYSIYFSALAQSLQAESAKAQASEATPQIWVAALRSALARLYTYTRARPPSRTLVDPLAAFTDNLEKDFKAATEAASSAAIATKDVDAKAGRSAYVDTSLLQREKVPDPGAFGVKTILEALEL